MKSIKSIKSVGHKMRRNKFSAAMTACIEKVMAMTQNHVAEAWPGPGESIFDSQVPALDHMGSYIHQLLPGFSFEDIEDL